jgi:RNA polymerase sigma-70 factor (ECF subfamily)
MTPLNRHLMPDFSDATSDDLLLARIASGAADALATLFRRKQAEVYRFALHMSGTTAVADDVTQDVFVVVMRDASRYEPGRSTVTAWLCGIARNCVRQRLERESRWQSLDDGAVGDDAQLPAIEADPLADLTRNERLAMLRRAVLALPLRYREVVVLCDLEELSYLEAAAALGCALGTVRSRLHRARAMLARRLTALQDRTAAPGETAKRGDAPLPVPQKRCIA